MSREATILQRYLDRWSNGDGVVGTTVVSNNGNVFHWDVSIIGPAGSFYEGNILHLDMHFPSDFPSGRPTVSFNAQPLKVFHCNVREDGDMCLQSLNSWKRASKIQDVVKEVVGLLSSPNPDAGPNNEACELYKTNLAGYQRKVQDWASRV